MKETLIQVYEDISYDINTIWDESYEVVDNRVEKIESVLSFFNKNEDVKEELIEIIKYYVYRLYEELNKGGNKMDKKVYLIKWEESYEGGLYSSGVSYVFDALEKAKTMLEEIKKDIIDNSEREDITDLIHNNLYGEGFKVDYLDNDYESYEIFEMEVK